MCAAIDGASRVLVRIRASIFGSALSAACLLYSARSRRARLKNAPTPATLPRVVYERCFRPNCLAELKQNFINFGPLARQAFKLTIRVALFVAPFGSTRFLLVPKDARPTAPFS